MSLTKFKQRDALTRQKARVPRERQLVKEPGKHLIRAKRSLVHSATFEFISQFSKAGGRNGSGVEGGPDEDVSFSFPFLFSLFPSPPPSPASASPLLSRFI